MSEEKIGVTILKCDFEQNPLIYQPSVKVFLVDSQSGDDLSTLKEVPSTKQFFVFQQGSNVPVWDDTLTFNRNINEITEQKSTKILILFEVCDIVCQPTAALKRPNAEQVTLRMAWAFLKPVGINGSLNVNKELRLQLFKVRKNCSIAHQTCPIFHLYSSHGRKKYPGSLYISVKGVKPTEAAVESSASLRQTSPTRRVTADATDLSPEPVPCNLELTKWSRLPTQSCKLVNNKQANVSITRRGASCVSFSHSGNYLACSSFAQIVIVDTLTSKLVSKVSGHTGLIYEVNWSTDDSLLLSVSADCAAVIWSMKPLSKSPLYVLPHPSFVYCGKWLRTGCRLVTGGKDSNIRFWGRSGVDFELLQELNDHIGFISAIETHGDVMFSGDSSGCIRLWNLSGDKWSHIRNFSHRELTGAAIDAIHMHPGQRRVVATARGRGSFMIDMTGGVLVRSYKCSPMNTRSVSCLSPCGSLLFSFCFRNIVNVWEFDTGKLIACYENIFPDLGFSTELSGYIDYHPYEHMAAFAILGFNYPVVILKYDRDNNHSENLGLILHATKANETNKSSEDRSKEQRMKPTPSEANVLSQNYDSTGDKLAAIVRNIDKVLAAKKQMLGHLSRHSSPRQGNQ